MGIEGGNSSLEKAAAVALLLMVAAPVLAGESAVLNNGFRIHAESHEVIGATIRLHVGEGSIEIPAAAVGHFETDDVADRPASPPVVHTGIRAGAPANATGPRAFTDRANPGAERPTRPSVLLLPGMVMPADSDLWPSNQRAVPAERPAPPVSPGPGGDPE